MIPKIVELHSGINSTVQQNYLKKLTQNMYGQYMMNRVPLVRAKFRKQFLES